jgi:hypothetical protein
VHGGEGQGLIVRAAALLDAVEEGGLDAHRDGGGAVERHAVFLVAPVLFGVIVFLFWGVGGAVGGRGVVRVCGGGLGGSGG